MFSQNTYILAMRANYASMIDTKPMSLWTAFNFEKLFNSWQRKWMSRWTWQALRKIYLLDLLLIFYWPHMPSLQFGKSTRSRPWQKHRSRPWLPQWWQKPPLCKLGFRVHPIPLPLIDLMVRQTLRENGKDNAYQKWVVSICLGGSWPDIERNCWKWEAPPVGSRWLDLSLICKKHYNSGRKQH